MKANIKSKVLAALLVAILAVGGGSLYVRNRDNGNASSTNTTDTQQSVQPEAKLTVSEDKKTVSYDGQTGKTALEVLKSLADVKTQTSSYGDFVTSIGGVEADGVKEFWSFYVDGVMASEGAGTYQTKDGQKIEWKVEAVL